MPKGVLDPSTPQCTATSRGSGKRCKLPAIKGGTVCRRHGGSAPQVKRAARERFNDLVDPMINITEKMMKDAEEGKLSVQEQLALVKFVADRTGFVPGKTVNIDGKAKWEVALTTIVREVPEEYVDAEVIEDEDDGENELERHERLEAERREQAYREEERDRARAALPHLPRSEDRRERPVPQRAEKVH